MKLDERGIPEVPEGATCAPECPPSPCQECAFGKPINWDKSNFEWCQEMNTCAATIDWDLIAERRQDSW